ncbi:MAG: ROK family transcriptional regulator [Treponema sp.]|nr:ROK family transcriptional regulator [Spirochaetia bacterium]MDY2839632.1 ROK family transcriptional regulator [Treponema sp.]MDY5123218.1 ROK family transcriptional regulator [Treponema sp.]
MKHVGLNMEQVKINNRSSILKYINDVGPVSRKDIAIATGLTPSAVTQICTALIQDGLLKELGTVDAASGAGRKKVLVDIDYQCAYILTINIESEETIIAVADMKGDVVHYTEMETDTSISAEDFLKQCARKCRLVLVSESCSAITVKGISVTVPGAIDAERGVSLQAYGIWEKEVPVVQILKNELGLDVFLDNNVNAFATAELLYGVGRKYDNFLLVKWGPGVGSAIIIDNSIYEGRHGRAAELGHYIVDLNGKKCSCGKTGCLETKVSYHALSQLMSFNQENFAESYESSPENIKKQIDEVLTVFAMSIVNSITILAPNRVVLCGKLFRNEKIRQILIEKCMELDTRLAESRILYTELSSKEDFIGPVAVYVKEKVYS